MKRKKQGKGAVVLEQAAYFERLKDKRVLVLGLGVSNQPLVRLLLSYGIETVGCDRTPREKLDAAVSDLEQQGLKLHLGEDYLKNISGDVAFRTPGLHPLTPELSALRENGTVFTSEMEAFFALCPSEIIGVTGSDGKTTTATLIAQLLRRAGHRVWLGGNIGTPLLDKTPDMLPTDKVVLELSSFQLMDFPSSCHIAVVTNLAPNHLDIHRNMEEYIQAKKNIFLHQTAQDVLILNNDNALTAALAAEAKGQVRWFSRQAAPHNGVFYRGGVIYRGATAVLRREELLLPGEHNVENFMAAMAAVEGMVSDADIRAEASSFGGVEHRIELVRVLDGVRYYNDSIASSPSRTIAGLRSFNEKVILIAGGYDKHLSYDELGREIARHVKLLVCTGDTGEKIAQATESAENPPQILRIADFYEAVKIASAHAKPGDVVLLSPAGAAFDRFKNFMVRGAEFKKTVMSL